MSDLLMASSLQSQARMIRMCKQIFIIQKEFWKQN